MKSSRQKRKSRSYDSHRRSKAAAANRASVLTAARELFAKRGVDKVSIAIIATKAGVSASTIYAVFKSKEGILRELMRTALFGPRFQEARTLLDGVTDPVERLVRTAWVARAIYESESDELGAVRGVSAFSPALRRMEEEFETMRYEMQSERLRALAESGNLRQGQTIDDARRILWMLTGRETYRMLVEVGGWSGDKYQKWLESALLDALVQSPRQR